MTEPARSPSDLFEPESDSQYCMRCGHRRMDQLRMCAYCRFDLDTPGPAEAAQLGPTTPTVRLVPSDEPVAITRGPGGGRKRWLLLGPIA
jgi:hypothetical protein